MLLYQDGIQTIIRMAAVYGAEIGIDTNAQITALADALGWPYEIKHLVFRRTELITNILAGPTLTGVIRERSSPLAPPWPDLMISAGRRNEPACRWVRERAPGARLPS